MYNCQMAWKPSTRIFSAQALCESFSESFSELVQFYCNSENDSENDSETRNCNWIAPPGSPASTAPSQDQWTYSRVISTFCPILALSCDTLQIIFTLSCLKILLLVYLMCLTWTIFARPINTQVPLDSDWCCPLSFMRIEGRSGHVDSQVRVHLLDDPCIWCMCCHLLSDIPPAEDGV